MRFPSKVTPFGESILPLAGEFLKQIPNVGIPVHRLFQHAQKMEIGTSDFFQVLDFLFMIGKIEITPAKEVRHVG